MIQTMITDLIIVIKWWRSHTKGWWISKMLYQARNESRHYQLRHSEQLLWSSLFARSLRTMSWTEPIHHNY